MPAGPGESVETQRMTTDNVQGECEGFPYFSFTPPLLVVTPVPTE